MAFRLSGSLATSENGHESFTAQHYYSPLQSGPVASSTNPAPAMPIGHWKRQLRESGVATCVHAQCQINFLSLAGIVAHSKTCSGYAPAGDFVPCNVCGLRFKQYKSMQSHRDRNHYHQVVGVAPPPPAPSGNLVLKEVSQYSSAFGPNTTVYVAETEPAKRVAHRHRPNVLRSYSRVPADKDPTVLPAPKIEDHANVSYLPPDIAQEVLAPTYTERVDAAQKAAITSRLIAESQMISTPRPAGRPVTYYTPRKPAPTLSQYHDPFDMGTANGAPQYELNPPKVEPTTLPGYQTLTVERQTTPRRQTQLKPIYIDASPAEGHYYEVSSSGQNSASGKQFRYIDVGPNQSGGRRIIFANSNLTITQQQPQQPQPPPTPVSLPSSAGSEVSSYSTTPSPAILSESGHSIERDQSNRQTFDSTSSVPAQYRYEGQEMIRPSSIQPQSSVNETVRPLKMSPNASSGGPSPSCTSSQNNAISHQVKEQPPQQQPSTLSDIDLRERELADEEAKLAEYERIVLESEEKAKEARRKRLEEREAQLRLRKEALQKRHLQAVAAIETAPKVEEDLGTGVTPRSDPEISQVPNPKHEPSSSSQQEIREIDASSPALLHSNIQTSKDTSCQEKWSDSGDFAKEQIVVPVEIQERSSSEQPETPTKIAEEPSEDTTIVPEDSNQTSIVPQESQDEEEKDSIPLSIPRSIPVELITTREGSDGSIQTFSEITEIIPEGIALDPGAKVLHISTDGFTETLVMHTLEQNEEHHTSSNEETRKEDTQTKVVEPPQLQELEISSVSKETESIEPEVHLEPMVETEVVPAEIEPEIEPEIEADIEAAPPNVIVQSNEVLDSTNCKDLVALSKTKERGEEDSEKAINEIAENQTSDEALESQPNLDATQESFDQSDKQSKHLTEEKEEEENAEPEQNAEEEQDNQPLERKKKRRTMTKTHTPIVPTTKNQRKSRTRKSLEPISTPKIAVQTPRSRRAQKRPLVDKPEPSEPKVKKKSSPKTPKTEPRKCVRRSNAPKFQCGKCETVFSTNRQFEAHVAQEHSGLARLIGENQEFKTKERDSALRNAFKLAAKVKCCQDQCDRVFSSYAGLQYHLRTCQKSPDEIELMKLKCRLCDYRGFPINMRQHELRHPGYQKISPPIEDEPVNEEIPSPTENQSEDFNDNSLTQSGRKRRRAATKASVKVNETIKILKTKVEGDVSDIDERDGDDDQDEVFNVGKAVDIKAHYKNNKKEKTFSCLHCQSIFKIRSEIESHLMSAHSEEMDDGDADEDEGFPDEEFSEGECSLVDEREEEEFVGRSRKSIKGFGKARHRLEKSSVLSSTTDLIPYEGKFRLANFEKNPFSDFHSIKADWTVLDQDQARDYLPESMESLQFNSRHCSVTTDRPLNKTSLKLFQSLEAEGDRSVTFFTGGPIRSSAWLPMSDVKSEWAYLALSSMRNMSDGQTFVTSAQTAKGLIQIWRVHVKSLASEMVMGLSHDLGTIWDMTWVPSGNQIPSEDPCHLKRLGILACASSEGTVRVFSICLFSELENPFPGSPLICQTQSKRTLRLCANPDLDEPSKSACVTLSWFRGQNHRILAGGFCDGRFALWDLFQPEGSIQRQGQDIYPYLHHSAHTAGITALDLNDIPSHSDPDFPRELVTGSYDRGVAVWDLDHPTLPTQFLRKGLVMGLDWLRHHPGEVMVSFDDVFLQSHTQSVVFDFASPNVKAHPVMAHNSAVWSQSTSPWLNVMATASTAGEVILFMAPPLTRALENDKDTNRRRVYLYTTNVSQCASTPPEIQSNDDFGNVENESLEFVDVATGDIRSLPMEIQKKTRYFETMPMEDITRYPIRSVNQIRLNPNPQNLGLVFSGTQAGFGRIHFVESLLNPEIRSQLKKYLVS